MEIVGRHKPTAAVLASVGESCWDEYLPSGDRRPGGIAANFAWSAAQAGAQVLLVSAVGDDQDGARMLEELGRAPFDIRGVRALPGRTSRQKLRLQEGERVFCGYDPGVAAALRLGAEDRTRLSRCDAIACCDGLPDLLEELIGIGPPVLCDISQDTDGNVPDRPELWLERWLDRVHVAFVGGSVAFRDRLGALAPRTRTTIVLTAGDDGAFAWSGGHEFAQPSVARCVVDTNGCGDALQGAFAAAWTRGDGIAAALAEGARAAAHVAARYGAQPR